MDLVPDQIDVSDLIICVLKRVSHEACHEVQDVDKRAVTLHETKNHGGCLVEDGFLEVRSFLLIPLELAEDTVHIGGSS